MTVDEVTHKIIGAAMEVHRTLGPGLLESAYRDCLCYELSLRGLFFEREKQLPVHYKDLTLDCGYRMDLLVDSRVVVEIKAVEESLPVHEYQLITYLKMSGCHVGLLINFNVPILRKGIRRRVMGYHAEAATASA